MNGAMALDCAKIMTRPTRRSARSIGVSHHHLCCQKNCTSSLIIPTRLTSPSMIHMGFRTSGLRARGLVDQAIAEHEGVHPALAEGAEGLGRRVDNGLAPQIERRVEHDRHPGRVAECLYQPIVSRIDVPPDG